jgi:hypothetical protein
MESTKCALAPDTYMPNTGSNLKRPRLDTQPPRTCDTYNHQGNQPFQRDTPEAIPCSVCVICPGRDQHNVQQCAHPRLWDGSLDTFSERKGTNAALYLKTGQVLCMDWNVQANRCTGRSHDECHLCLGCNCKQ